MIYIKVDKCQSIGCDQPAESLVATHDRKLKALCRYCGAINLELKLSDREWACDCGAVLDRDENAAINLKNLAVRRVPPEVTPAESDVRPVVSLAASMKQEPSVESDSRF